MFLTPEEDNSPTMSDYGVITYDVAVCMSKVKYRTHYVARKALIEIRKRGSIRGKSSKVGKIEVYYCRVCDQFHHGHEAKDNRRSIQPINLEETA